MTFRSALALALMVTASFTGAATAAECPQANAIYQDSDKAYEIRFSPVPAAAATSHMFKLAELKSNLILDGVVLPEDEVERSVGTIMNNCPEGDVTGADLEACTIWEGVLYGIDAKGVIGDLPAATESAAEKLLVPDLGRSIRYSSIWDAGKATVAPWDVFTLTGCHA